MVTAKLPLQAWVQGETSEQQGFAVGNVSFAVRGDAEEQAGRAAKMHCRGLTAD